MEINDVKKQSVIVFVCSLLIVIFAGHGIGVLLIIEMPFIVNYGSYPFSLTPESYDESLGTVGLLFLIGQLIVIVSLFIKQKLFFIRLITVSIFFLIIGFGFLAFPSFSGDTLSIVSLVSGLPFIITLIVLIFRTMVFAKQV
jgi:hypothetical protein